MKKLTDGEATIIAKECLRGSLDEESKEKIKYIKKALIAVSEEFWMEGAKSGQYLSSH